MDFHLNFSFKAEFDIKKTNGDKHFKILETRRVRLGVPPLVVIDAIGSHEWGLDLALRPPPTWRQSVSSIGYMVTSRWRRRGARSKPH